MPSPGPSSFYTCTLTPKNFCTKCIGRPRHYSSILPLAFISAAGRTKGPDICLHKQPHEVWSKGEREWGSLWVLDSSKLLLQSSQLSNSPPETKPREPLF